MTRDLPSLMRTLRFATLLTLALLCGVARAQGGSAPTVEALDCRGNTNTSCGFILGHLYLADGDVLDEDEITNARLRLSSLPNFRSVDMYLERGSAKGKVRVVVEVVEADLYARELIGGTSWRGENLSQTFVGRLTHQNLFGTGRLLDFKLLGRIPLAGPTRRDLSARMQFVDPHLFDSRRDFLIAGISYDNQRDERADDTLTDIEALGIDLSVGRRFGDFSYFTVGYRYRPITEVLARRYQRADFITEHLSFPHQVMASVGWNSEDDAYFPSRGSRLGFSTWYSWPEGRTGVTAGFRKTWRTSSGSLWTLKLGNTPGTEYRWEYDEHQFVAFTYARPLAADFLDGGIRRGRWYVEPGYGENRNYGETITEFGLKAGVRFEAKSFGIVDLYIIGTTEHRSGGRE